MSVNYKLHLTHCQGSVVAEKLQECNQWKHYQIHCLTLSNCPLETKRLWPEVCESQTGKIETENSCSWIQHKVFQNAPSFFIKNYTTCMRYSGVLDDLDFWLKNWLLKWPPQSCKCIFCLAVNSKHVKCLKIKILWNWMKKYKQIKYIQILILTLVYRS